MDDPFLEAIESGDIKTVRRFLLGDSSDLDVPNEDGVSPLSLAEKEGNWPIESILLDHALFVATWKGQKDKVISLLNRGAEPKFVPQHVTHNVEILDIIQKRMKRRAYLRKVRSERNKSEKLIKNYNEMRIDRIMENAVRRPRAASARKSRNMGLNETKFQDPPRPRRTRRNVPRRARSLNRKALLNLHNTLPENKRIYKDLIDRNNIENVVINEN